MARIAQTNDDACNVAIALFTLDDVVLSTMRKQRGSGKQPVAKPFHGIQITRRDYGRFELV